MKRLRTVFRALLLTSGISSSEDLGLGSGDLKVGVALLLRVRGRDDGGLELERLGHFCNRLLLLLFLLLLLLLF